MKLKILNVLYLFSLLEIMNSKIESFKLKEDLITEELGDLKIKSNHCKYKVKMKLKSFNLKKVQKGFEAEISIKVEEKLVSQNKTKIKSLNKVIKHSELDKRFKGLDVDDYRLDSAEIRFLKKNMYWKNTEEDPKKNKDKNYFFLDLNKEKEDEEINYEFKKVPCDMDLPNLQLKKMSLAKSVGKEDVIIIFEKDVNIIDVNLDFEFDFLNKFHLNYNSEQFIEKFCNFSKNKFKSKHYSKFLCKSLILNNGKQQPRNKNNKTNLHDEFDEDDDYFDTFDYYNSGQDHGIEFVDVNGLIF